jgi:hypothetical protein
MQNRTEPLARHASPGRDPIVLAMKALAALLAVVAASMIISWAHRVQAEAALNCPPQDHPVWASTLKPPQWICGESLQVGVKSR